MPLDDYERLLYDWLMRQEYKTLDWAVDKGVRDTGPFVEGESYGTHPAVRIFYSPEVLAWLQDDRQGTIADGAMIVKLPDGLDAANLSVKVTMNYQAIPPYWLHQRFSLAPDGEATRRLYYLTSHLDLTGTAIEGWKLSLVTATADVQ